MDRSKGPRRGEPGRLTVATVTRLLRERTPGRYADGGGVRLDISDSGAASWIFRYRSPVRNVIREMGMGSASTLSLCAARAAGLEHRVSLLRGVDPLDKRNIEKAARTAEASKSISFAEAAKRYIDTHRGEWRNPRSAAAWPQTFRGFCGPIAKMSVAEIDAAAILRVLQPIWQEKSVTASRLRGRIEQILSWAKANGFRDGDNPAAWSTLAGALCGAASRSTGRDNACLSAPPTRRTICAMTPATVAFGQSGSSNSISTPCAAISISCGPRRIFYEQRGDSIRLDPALWGDAAIEQEARLIAEPWIETIAEVLGDCYGEIARSDAWRIFGVPDERQTQGAGRQSAQSVSGERLGSIVFPDRKIGAGCDLTASCDIALGSRLPAARAARTARACPPLRSSANTKK
jgi:hypothetical protein